MRAKVSFIIESSCLETIQNIKEAIQELFELDTDSDLPGSPDFELRRSMVSLLNCFASSSAGNPRLFLLQFVAKHKKYTEYLAKINKMLTFAVYHE